jgi:hypothetical protein
MKLNLPKLNLYKLINNYKLIIADFTIYNFFQNIDSSIAYKSLFVHRDCITPNITVPLNENFISVSFLFCLVILALTNVIYRRRLRQIIKSFINQSTIKQLIRDGNLLNETISLFLLLNYFVLYSIIIYISNKYILTSSFFSNSGYILFIQIISIVISFFILKILLIRLTGTIFKTKKETREYLLLLFIFNESTGLILFPFLVFIIYLKLYFLLYFLLFILLLILFYRILRVIFNRISVSNFSVYYLILYLCGIEILPLLIFFKLIYSYLS